MKKFINKTTAQFEAMQSVLHPAAITYLGGWIPDVVRSPAGQYIGVVYDRSREVFASVALSEYEVGRLVAQLDDIRVDDYEYPKAIFNTISRAHARKVAEQEALNEGAF